MTMRWVALTYEAANSKKVLEPEVIFEDDSWWDQEWLKVESRVRWNAGAVTKDE
jgi:hypothetical protein